MYSDYRRMVKRQNASVKGEKLIIFLYTVVAVLFSV